MVDGASPRHSSNRLRFRKRRSGVPKSGFHSCKGGIHFLEPQTRFEGARVEGVKVWVKETRSGRDLGDCYTSSNASPDLQSCQISHGARSTLSVRDLAERAGVLRGRNDKVIVRNDKVRGRNDKVIGRNNKVSEERQG